MHQFMGNHRNRLDSKGRVSIPALFRSELRRHDGATDGLVLRPSHQLPCIEAWPSSVFYGLAGSLDRLDLFDAQNDDLAAAVYADAFPIEPDRDGRIVLPADLVAHAGINDAVTFLGLGRRFHLWEPEAGERWRVGARERAKASGRTVPGVVA